MIKLRNFILLGLLEEPFLLAFVEKHLLWKLEYLLLLLKSEIGLVRSQLNINNFFDLV